jgi:hypothetical protein
MQTKYKNSGDVATTLRLGMKSLPIRSLAKPQAHKPQVSVLLMMLTVSPDKTLQRTARFRYWQWKN